MDEKAKDSNATDISCIEEYFATHTDAKTDYDKIGRSILEGTAGWVLEEKSYKAWFEEDTPFLWISGFPGSGKSHLAYFRGEKSARVNRFVNEDVGCVFFL
jgi:hypothetical protein